MRLAIFDCDGTLVDSQADICAAMDAAFAAAGLVPPERHATRRVVGLSLHEAMRQLHPAGAHEDHASLTELYKDAFRARRAAGAVAEPLYEGIAGLVEQLAAEGWQLAVATGKSDRGLAHCLATHGLTRHFVSLQTADRHPSKPDPSMIEQCIADAGADRHRTAMIGDTVYDIVMARNAGVRGIGVDWGYHETEELFEAGAEAVATSIAELRALLGAIK
ncbi:HAD-superfamily hydrolase, subfamily IA, variant 1 [Novosphingobium aromaticivorans DSM 12444]|uniref:HAD-superfamily hydrolase, subfamily IA, variant 1 n=1 Tax=Novosphingobium aromaticivorans (strain ATCC 700278 / DSM 12444 / CCUG 56034 / CIP 105152 / NBRC 16084 / F199) TaxID=279238 RepID=Q2G4E8_NOVAD|nr:HAD-IA family hydrolase [Novosphingobium aromaticivorans]ABD27275.1 HAD-superfamily hydrolase, subfamily IA, variant 1 [Novosphingobium aromaticivorans DSM 12444]SCY66002.1 phosphoglycolate phosphatase [Novosphingobium aromaticivorans]